MSRQLFFATLFLSLLLAACTSVEPTPTPTAVTAALNVTAVPPTRTVPPVPTAANTPTETPTGTAVPATPSHTPEPVPTASPTLLPTISPTPVTPAATAPAIWTIIGTPMPQVHAVLSPENITQIQEIGRWGKGNIIDAAYSPDRSQLIVATALGVYVYETETARQISFFPVENMQLAAMAISPDWQWVAMGIEPDQIELRQLQDGSLHHTLTSPQSVRSLTFTTDGQFLLAPNTAWRVSDGAPIKSTFGNDYLSSNGKIIASTAGDGIEIYELAIGNEISVSRTGVSIPDTFYNLSHLALSPNGEYLALGGWGDVVEIYRTSNGTLHCSLNFAPANTLLPRHRLASPARNNSPGPHRVVDLQFTPDGQALAIVSGFEELTLWQTNDCRLQRRIPDLYGEIMFSADGARVAAWWGTLTQWDTATGERLNQLRQHASWINDLAFTPTGSHLAIASNYIYLRNMTDGGVLTSLPKSANNVAISPDGQTLLSTDDKDLFIWNLEDGSHFSVKAARSSWPIVDIALSPDGQMVATVAGDDGARVWRVNDGQPLSAGYSMFPQRVAFSPAEHILAVQGNNEAPLELWPAPPLSAENETAWPSGQATWRSPIYSLYLPEEDYDSLQSLAFSPDGALLAAGFGNKIYIWRVENETLLQILESHAHVIEDLVFSPDGQLLASTSYDKTLKLWRVTDGVLLHTINLPSNPRSLAISPDGRILAIGSTDGTVRLWGIP